MNPDTQKEIAATTRWGVSLLVALIIQAGTVFYWAATIQSKVEQNTSDIEKLESEVDNITDDIRSILLGIEQVKARLGIIEAIP